MNTRDIFTALLHITTHNTISAMEVPGGNPNLKLNSKAQEKTRTIGIFKKFYYFWRFFTYIGHHCLQIRTQIRKFCSSAFPYQSICFVFPHCLRLAYFFPFRDRVPKSLRSRMVYQFKCQMIFFVVFRTEKSSFSHVNLRPLGYLCSYCDKLTLRLQASFLTTARPDIRFPQKSLLYYLPRRLILPTEILIRESLLIKRLNPSLDINTSSLPLTLF